MTREQERTANEKLAIEVTTTRRTTATEVLPLPQLSHNDGQALYGYTPIKKSERCCGLWCTPSRMAPVWLARLQGDFYVRKKMRYLVRESVARALVGLGWKSQLGASSLSVTGNNCLNRRPLLNTFEISNWLVCPRQKTYASLSFPLPHRECG